MKVECPGRSLLSVSSCWSLWDPSILSPHRTERTSTQTHAMFIRRQSSR